MKLLLSCKYFVMSKRFWLCAGLCSSVLFILKMPNVKVDRFSNETLVSRGCQISDPGFCLICIITTTSQLGLYVVVSSL